MSLLTTAYRTGHGGLILRLVVEDPLLSVSGKLVGLRSFFISVVYLSCTDLCLCACKSASLIVTNVKGSFRLWTIERKTGLYLLPSTVNQGGLWCLEIFSLQQSKHSRWISAQQNWSWRFHYMQSRVQTHRQHLSTLCLSRCVDPRWLRTRCVCLDKSIAFAFFRAPSPSCRFYLSFCAHLCSRIDAR